MSSSMAGSKVSEIITSLGSLEDDLGSLNEKVAGMKRQLLVNVQAEIKKTLESGQEMAIKEAGAIIDEAKKKAADQSAAITKEGEAALSKIQAKIDANFDDAVKYVVSTVLKA